MKNGLTATWPLKKLFCQKNIEKIEENDFAKNFFRNLRMCEVLANGIVKNFLYQVYALQYLINIEEQAKSFWLTIIVHQQEAMTQNNITLLHI